MSGTRVLKRTGSGGGGSGTSGPNEVAASSLVNATSAGDAGNRSDHFTGASLGGGWASEGTAPTALTVGKSSLTVDATGGANLQMRAFTPSGAFRVELRFVVLVDQGSSGGAMLAIEDSASAHAGDAIQFGLSPTGSLSTDFYTWDGGSPNNRGTLAGVRIDRGYLAVERNGSNQWNCYISADRSGWKRIGTANWSKTFTVAKMGIQTGSGVVASYDFIDVVS